MSIWAVSVVIRTILFVSWYNTLTTILRSFAIHAGGGLPVCRAAHVEHVLGEVSDRYSGRPIWGLGVGLILISYQPLQRRGYGPKAESAVGEKRSILSSWNRHKDHHAACDPRAATRTSLSAHPSLVFNTTLPRRHPGSGLCGFYFPEDLEKQILDHTLHRASDHGVRGVKTREVSNSMETSAGWAGYDVIRLR
jgi:hypothetical protein